MLTRTRLDVLLSFALLFTGCAGVERPDPERSSLTLRVELDGAPGAERVHYRLAGEGPLPAVGSVVVGLDGRSATVVLPAPAGGPGYRVDLSAESADEGELCRGSFTADPKLFRGGQLSAARLVLLCRPGDEAEPSGDAVCPRLDSYGASSFSAPVGAEVQLYATASDENDEDQLRFRWTSDRGRVIKSNAARARFACDRAGTFTVTAAVDDGWCTSGVFFTITCQEDVPGPLAGR